MRVVYKFQIRYKINEIDLEPGAEVLAFQNQNEDLFIWALLDPAEPTIKRTFEILGTGQSISDEESWLYVGTAQQEAYVWHLFEKFIA